LQRSDVGVHLFAEFFKFGYSLVEVFQFCPNVFVARCEEAYSQRKQEHVYICSHNIHVVNRYC
jgi:hypothetical protein